jgi:hypothetical protein
MIKILIGTDPEVFVKSMTTGEFISGHDLIPGTKEEPFAVQGGAIQVDGLACEFNTDPVDNSVEFTQNISSVMSTLEEKIKSVDPDYSIAIVPTATFNREYFDSLPEEPKVLGCTPDFSAYTMKENIPPETTEPFRTGAGHIHIGWSYGEDVTNAEHLKKCAEVVKQLDAVLYPSSLIWDRDKKRRTLYGKIGAFRPKHYGVEYRPLSNAYLARKDIQEFVFDTAMIATRMLFDKGIRIFDNNVVKEVTNDILENKAYALSDVCSHLEWLRVKFETPLYGRAG